MIYSQIGEISFEEILTKGFTITTSGTTGKPKKIHRTPANLQLSIANSIKAQNLTKDSKLLHITRLDHAVLIIHALPGFLLGADVYCKKFNAFSFLEDFKEKTHVFLAPGHMKAIMNCKGWDGADFTGQHILCGSEPVSWDIIEAFVEKNAIVQPNWGMSEIGPVTIYSIYDDIKKVREDKEKYANKFILGDTFLCDYKIVDNVLWVKGDTCISDDWFCTDDIVEEIDGKLFFSNRVHKDGAKPFRLDSTKWQID